MTWKGTRPRLAGRAMQRRNAWVLTRDAHICGVCDQHGATEVDHIIPVAEGGTDHPDNLQAICVPCHKLKTQDEAQRGRRRKRQHPKASHPGVRP